MIIKINGKEFDFSSSSKLIPKKSRYDLELIEDEFDEKTKKLEAGGVDANLQLPWIIERSISRTSLLPVAKVFIDKNGNKKLTAYFD